MTIYNFINLEDFTHLFLPSFFVGICFIIVFFAIGGITRSIFFLEFKNKFNTANLFYNVVIGMILMVFGISLYKTNLHSINILFLLVGGGFLYKRKDLLSENTKDFSSRVNWILIGTGYIFIYTVHFLTLYQQNATIPLSNFRLDDLFYSLVSYNIYNQSIENPFHVINYITDNENIVLTYYHYFELWLTGIIHRIDNQNINQTFALQTSTLISFIGVLGVYFLLDVYFRLKTKHLYFLLFFFMIFSPIYFSFYSILFGKSGVSYHIPSIFFGNEFTIGIKVSILLIPFIILYYFLLQKKLLLTTLSMSIIILLNAVTIPSMAVFSFFLCLYAFVKKDPEKWDVFIYNAIFYVIFMAFYYFHGAFDNPITGDISLPFWQKVYFHVRLPLSLTIKNTVMYSPYFFIILVLGGKNFIIQYKKEIIIYFFMILCCSIISSLFYKKINYIQIFSMPSVLITYCFFIYFFSKLLGVLNFYKKSIFVGFLGILSIYSLYLQSNRENIIVNSSDDEFSQSFQKSFENENKLWGVWLAEITNVEPYNVVSTYNSPFSFLSTLHSGTFTVSLSHYGLTHQTPDPIDSINIEWALQKDPFTLFINEQKKNNLYTSPEQSRLDFILKYRPKFLAVHKEEMIPSNFIPYLDKRITTKDNGVIIYIFNYEKQ